LFLLEKACAGIEAGYPNEAFLQVEGIWEPGIGVEENSAFARQLGKMYRNWAERRVMNCEVLEERISEDCTPYLLRLAISGYAAYSLLAHEEGLHLLEIPESEGKSFRRAKVRVRVVPQPEEPPGNIEMLREHAEKQMTAPVPVNPEVVRRYRESPSPLVRDNFLGWRTGRLDKVWEGNFDLFPGLLDPKPQSTTE
jgi:ATP-dependent Clp protease ATP-binding subunit ClpC